MPITKQSLIVHSNQINKAAYSFTLVETRLILIALSQVSNLTPISDDQRYYIKSADLVSLGANKRSVYKQMKEAVKTLFERKVFLISVDGKTKLEFRWIQSIEYKDNEGVIGIRFSKDLLPFISNLTEEFTSYPLLDVAGFSSEYAIRLYSLIMQFKSTGWLSISVDELRERFDLKDKYPRYQSLKDNVIDPAVTQINKKGKISISYTTKKTGRKITELLFCFTPQVEKIPVVVEEEIITLTEKQIFSFSIKLMADEKISREFFDMVIRENYMDLRGLNDEQVLDKLKNFLKTPTGVKIALPYLKKVGFSLNS